jgi:hypothetical protein
MLSRESLHHYVVMTLLQALIDSSGLLRGLA